MYSSKTYFPTEEDLNDFERYVSKIEPEFRPFGGAKIVPPKNFDPRKEGYELDKINFKLNCIQVIFKALLKLS